MGNSLNSNRIVQNKSADSDQPNYQHNWLRIALILLSVIAFILTCTFNGLASGGSNGIFTQSTGKVSDNNLTDFTPAGWTFSIWGLIYFWQAAWLIYAISRIFRKSTRTYLYLEPDTLPDYVFILYIINLILNIVWLVIWDRAHFGWAVLIIFLMLITVLVPMIITHIRLQDDRISYINLNLKKEIWFVRAFVHNGLAIYGTWLYLATLLNFTIWISEIYDRKTEAISNVSTAALSLVLVGIVVYFILENFVFYSSMAYTWTPWFVLVFALGGILSKNQSSTMKPHERNQHFVLALFIMSIVLAVLRLILFILRYMKNRIPTLQDP